jgi:putative hydrolase of the HAD superfamily
MQNKIQPLKHYQHIFFDLDNTLWDYRTNARETFSEILKEMKLNQLLERFEEFLLLFDKYNDQYWQAYRNGMTSKETLRKSRFSDTLRFFGIQDVSIVSQVADLYQQRVSRKANLFPGVHETLGYLKEKYRLYIITNGFAEIQTNKIESSDINKYFIRVFMAEMTGFQKPDKRFFHYALSSVNAKKSESIMVGDDVEADIQGARDAGIDQVFFNPLGKMHDIPTTYEIKSINELRILF